MSFRQHLMNPNIHYNLCIYITMHGDVTHVPSIPTECYVDPVYKSIDLGRPRVFGAVLCSSSCGNWQPSPLWFSWVRKRHKKNSNYSFKKRIIIVFRHHTHLCHFTTTNTHSYFHLSRKCGQYVHTVWHQHAYWWAMLFICIVIATSI